MDLQTRKLQFIEEYLSLTNTSIIDKLEKLLLQEKKKSGKSKLSAMSLDEFYLRNAKSQMEIKTGKLISQSDVKKYFNAK